MRRISVLTDDIYLYQKIKLALLGRAEVTLGKAPSDVKMVDLDSGYEAAPEDITMSKWNECDLSLPFPISALDRLVNDSGAPMLTASDSEKCAILRGEAIRLTEVEYALFSALIKRGGKFVSREDILEEVWGNEADSGIINVYVHYLREKLEKEGEKIIVSSRKMGYKIDEKYL